MTTQEASAGPGHDPGMWWVPDANREWDRSSRSPANADRVIMHDVTLREAEQGFGVVLTATEMVRLAAELVRTGVRRLEMWPILSQHNRDAMRTISSEFPELQTYALVRPGFQKDLDVALECGASGVIVFTLSLNDWVAEHALRLDSEQVVDDIVKWVEHAASLGLHVVCGPGDAFRTPVHRLERLFREAKEAGAESVSINDSLGSALPSTMSALVKTARSWVGPEVKIECHCHNDYGLATANTLAGIQAGVDVAEVAINGYGERAGNAALEEVAMGSTALLGLDTGLDLSRLLDLCGLAADITGTPIPVNKPITGESLHHIWTSLHAAWRQRVTAAGRPEAWTPFVPQVIGREGYKVDLGPMAGNNLIQMKLLEVGLSVPDDDAVSRIRDLVKEEGRTRGGAVPISEFRRIVEKVSQEMSLDAAVIEA